MKIFVIACLIACSQANIFDDIGHVVVDAANTVGHGVVDAANTVEHGVVDTANTVGHGVVDAANTVGHGVVDAANAVGSVLGDIGNTIDATFPAVWNVVKDPLIDAGEQILIHAGEFVLEQGVTMALSALAAGKRELPDRQVLKEYLSAELVDEYIKWLKDSEDQILGSKDELAKAMQTFNFNQMPAELRTYISDYANSVVKGNPGTFVLKQADASMKSALKSLESRLQDRLIAAITKLS